MMLDLRDYKAGGEGFKCTFSGKGINVRKGNGICNCLSIYSDKR